MCIRGVLALLGTLVLSVVVPGRGNAMEGGVADAVRVVEAGEVAWNKGDIEGMLRLYTPDAEHVNASNGFHWKGKEELLSGWKQAWDFGRAHQEPETRDVRQLAPDVVLVVTKLRITSPRAPAGAPPIHGFATKVVVHKAGQWLITFSQSTQIDPIPAMPQAK